jgi:hypothetical protein
MMTVLKTMQVAGLATSVVLGFWAASAEAISIPIPNFSFEMPDAAGGFMNGVPTSWTGVAQDGNLFSWVENNSSIGFTGGDGAQHGGIEEGDGYIYQDLGVPFQANKTYRLNLASAHRAGWTNGTIQFGLFSSNAVGTNIGTPGFMDAHGVWSGSGNPDADNQFNQLRDASALQKIDLNGDGLESLGHIYKFDAGSTPPTGNIVVFIRQHGSVGRIQFDNVRLDEVPTVQKGDVDLDSDVDLNDLAAIQAHFRTSVADRSLGDLDEDGFVDFTDFLEWKAYFPYLGAGGATGASTNGAVPEPASSLLGLVAGLLILCGRPRSFPRSWAYNARLVGRSL